MKNFWQETKRPILVLAPMAGYTESPFRRLVKEIEPSTILVSELISAEAIRRDNKKTLDMCAFHKSEKKYFGIQLFGSELSAFTEAAKVVENLGADFVDLNFGCPSPKILKSSSGSAILKTPEKAVKLIETLAKTVKIPVTAKMRLGFFNDENLIETAKNFESAGLSALAIHGRTTKQKFSGTANWEKIYEVKDNLNIPVIGNGDVTSAEIAKEKLGNLDGVMIGRAAIKNPWIFKQCRELFSGTPVSPTPGISEQLNFFRRQAEISLEMKPEKIAILELRKNFSSFLRGFPNATKFREKLIRVTSVTEMNEVFDELENI